MKRAITAPGFRYAALAMAGALSWPVGARASDRREPMVVVVEGPRAEAVAGWIEDRLNAPDTLEEERTFRSALRVRGALPLHLAVTSAARDARLIACAHAAAGQADVQGALLVDLQTTPSATHIHVWKIDARPGGAGIESDIVLPPSASVLEESRAILGISPSAAPAVAESPQDAEPAVKPLAPPLPTPATRAPEPAQSPDMATFAPPVAASAHATSPFTVEAGLGVGMRHFSYVDRVTPSLRPYDLAATPIVSLSAAIYPLVFTRVSVLRNFGVTGDYGRAFSFSSEDSAGDRVGTSWQSFDVGATERIPLSRALLANVSVAYGGNDFQFDQGLGAAAALPSVAYRFVRAGADLRATVRSFSAFGGGSYLDLLSTGYTSALFPRQSVGGVEGHLGAAYVLARGCEVSVSASYTRVFYSFNPEPGDADVAGGALDEQTSLLAGLSYLM